MTSILRRIISKKRDSKNGDRVYVSDDFDETFATPKNVMSYINIKMTQNLSEKRTKIWNIMSWFALLNVAFATVFEIIQSVINVRKAKTFKDILNVVGLIPCTGFCILSLLKGIKIKRNIGIFENLYYELREMWPRGEVNEDEDHIIRRVFFQCKYIVKGYYWCNNALIIGFLYPSYKSTLRRYLGYDEPMTLTYEYWLPFDPHKPYIFELTLLWQSWHGLIVIFSNSLGDILYCTYLAHITMQFELLSERLRRLIYVRVDQHLIDSYPLAKISKEYIQNEEELLNSYTNRDWDVRQQRELIVIVKRHHALIRIIARGIGDLRRLRYARTRGDASLRYQKTSVSKRPFFHRHPIVADYSCALPIGRDRRYQSIDDFQNGGALRLAGDVEAMFSFSLPINFVYSSIIICLNGFLSVLIEKWNEMAYKAFLVTALSQTWLLCWYGQKLLDSSCGVSEAVYECGWYTASQRVKSSLLIMLLRSSRGVCITTYGFSIISLESYSTIIKTSWSYFTLLLNFFNTSIDTETT